MQPNTHPDTGIRYGVLSLNNSVRAELINDLWYHYGTNISEEEAYKEAERQYAEDWRNEREQADHEWRFFVTDDTTQQDYENFVSEFMGTFGDDEETYVERMMMDIDIQIDEPTITGTYDGVDYMITWLGGAPLLWILKGPHRAFCVQSCSPCVPNAGDLDGGYELAEDGDTYAPPWDWLDDDVAEEIKAKAAQYHL